MTITDWLSTQCQDLNCVKDILELLGGPTLVGRCLKTLWKEK